MTRGPEPRRPAPNKPQSHPGGHADEAVLIVILFAIAVVAALLGGGPPQ